MLPAGRKGAFAMARHLTMEELKAGLPEIRLAPKDHGELKAIVYRPQHDERRDVASATISLAGGVEGDHWAKKCWKETADGKPHPDVQICIMNARAIALIAGERANWASAGDNLYIDMDLSPENLPPGTRLKLGSAEIEITAEPHNGCAKFISRYGRDACVFVNTSEGKALRLRGIYARVVKDGRVSIGDVASKLPEPVAKVA
jgi:MOSC domain-containing protein YiiM